MKITRKMIEEKLAVDTISLKNGIVTVRDEFFYTHGRTAEHLAAKVLTAFPEAIILDKGEIWKPFRGGASTANSSHWFVKFQFPRTAEDVNRDQGREMEKALGPVI